MRKLLLPILVFGLVLSSCQDNLTSMNDNPKGARDVPAEPLFTNALVNFGTVTTDVHYGRNAFKHMAQYWSQTSYPGETQYNLSGTSGAYWSFVYRQVLSDLKEASRLVAEDESIVSDAQKTVMQAQIDLIEIMAFHQLVSVYGNVPYSGALDPENPAPAFDDEQKIYTKLLNRLDTVISDLGASSSGFSATADIFYNGNVGNWIKFAHSLKMRMAIQLSDVQPSVAKSAVEVASPNAFTSASESLMMPFTTSPPTTNTMWELAVQENRSDLLPSKRLVDMMNSFNDPRRAIQFTESGGSGQYEGAPFGTTNTFDDYSQPAGPILEAGFDGTLLDYTEVEFIRAEAAARGWNVSGTAETHYNNAIKSDMQYWSDASSEEEITTSDMNNYLAQTGVVYPTGGSLEDQIKVIAEQKWLALYMQGLQAWTDYRRLDHPTFNYQNNGNADITSEDDIPVRYTYPSSEQTLNTKNWQKAADAMGGDELGSHLFWDLSDATGPVD